METASKSNTAAVTLPATDQAALKFGPSWLRALSHGSSTPTAVSPETPAPKYKLAQYRYGREEMLALHMKDVKIPDCLKEFDFLVSDKCQMPLALLPMTEEEQRIWTRSVNSDVALRVSNKGPTGPGNGMPRGGRGGSVDRGRGRGRGNYHSRGFSFEDGEDGPLSGYSRLRPIERSQSASEKDQRWEERDRRFDRPFGTRTGGVLDDTTGILKPEGSRAPAENWRRSEKEDENGWRTTGSRGSGRFGTRGSWRNHNERDRGHIDYDAKDKVQHGRESILNGPVKNSSNHPRQRSSSGGHFWDEDFAGDNLPEWSVEDSTNTDVVGTFDSSGAFHETKSTENNVSREEIFVSDEEQEVVKPKEKSPESKPPVKQKETLEKSAPKKETTPKPPIVQSSSPPIIEKTVEKPLLETTCESKPIEPPSEVLREEVHVPQTHSVPTDPFGRPTMVSTTLPSSSLLGVKKNIVPAVPPPVSGSDVPGLIEEDTFAHHKTATENMMAQWTREINDYPGRSQLLKMFPNLESLPDIREKEEQRVVSEVVDKSIVLPVHHKDAYKWFYRDPQGEIQGPFGSNIMLEWFKGGFFQKDLKVRRGCDERFVQLGELTQIWKCIPFSSVNEPPPLRAVPVVTELPTPFTQSVSVSNHIPPPQPVPYPQTDASVYQQQIVQEFLLYRQVHMQQQIMNQLKHLDGFATLPLPQQSALVQQLLQQQQQVSRPTVNSVRESPVLDQVPNMQFPLINANMNVPSTVKNDLTLWNVPQATGNWSSGRSTAKPSSGSIWDTDTPSSTPIEVSELEKRMAAEEEEKHRLALETMKRLEEENKRKEEEKRKKEELKRKQEEERIRKEIEKQQEEEKKRLEELQRLKEEEQRRQEELQRLEEIRKEEERQLEELRKQEELKREELRKQEEQRLLEEQRKLAELEEQKRREKQKEELRRQEELLKHEEFKKQEELRIKAMWEQEQEKLKEIERQKELLRVKEEGEMELRTRKEVERERELQLKKDNENCLRFMEQKGPAWGLQNAEKPSTELSLIDIQRLQEKREREQREKLKFQQQLQQQQQNLKQAQSNKNGLSWAKRVNENFSSVKSLAEIQMEEAESLASQQKVQKTAATTVQASAASGVWGNSSQINRIAYAPTWNMNNSCFWDEALKSSPAPKPAKTNDSAFPALSNSVKPANVNSNKNKNVRAKKDENAVLRIFETHRKPNDEFTAWCTDALSNLPSSVDVPTFVSFLMDVESPYEIHDYVRSYLGEGKEAKEFGKQFLERRSKYRNQTKQSPAEENMWGPAPAITPPVNKAAAQTANDCDATICTKGRTRRKKNRMQKVDSSMLGFTVQPNPDRINIGEIDRVEGM